MKTRPRIDHQHPERSGRSRLILIGIMTLGCLAGCSSSSGGAKPVDAVGARQALQTAMESWKKGDPIGLLKEQNPKIVVQDLDWEGGAKLLEYKVLDEGRDEALNLSIPVELKLQTKAGKDAKKKVKYMVGTSPVITVFREIF
ncbi:hypothetical protein ACYOEI_31695 [Singulisphaera rosea]